MISSSKYFVVSIIFLVLFVHRLCADDLDLKAFKEVYANGSKEKGANIVYVNQDGTLGKKDDPAATPAIKLELLKEPEHLIMQDVTTPTETRKLNVRVEVWASSDLQHDKGDGLWKDLEPGIYHIQGTIVHPNMDFWIFGPGFSYDLANLGRGSWTTIEAHFISPYALKLHHLEFHVPAGTGFVYLKNFSATP